VQTAATSRPVPHLPDGCCFYRLGAVRAEVSAGPPVVEVPDDRAVRLLPGDRVDACSEWWCHGWPFWGQMVMAEH
jgi:hypothetical protein